MKVDLSLVFNASRHNAYVDASLPNTDDNTASGLVSSSPSSALDSDKGVASRRQANCSAIDERQQTELGSIKSSRRIVLDFWRQGKPTSVNTQKVVGRIHLRRRCFSELWVGVKDKMTGSRRVILRRLSMAGHSSGSSSSHKEERDSRSQVTSTTTTDASSSEAPTVTFSKSSVTDANRTSRRPRLYCGLMAPDDSGKPVKASDYERITVDTPSMGNVSMRRLSFSNRQMVRSQHKAEAEGTLFLVTNRKSWSLYYVLLRMSSYRFWTTVIFVQAALVLTGFIIFSAIHQPKGNAMLLGLDVNSLAVGDVECVAMFGDATWGCRAVAAVLSLASLVVSLFVGGVIVVRLSRVVAKHRFEFSKNAVIQDGELVVRFFSNRPSMVIMPTFRLEYFDMHGRARPLALINGGSICFMHDAVLYIRHDIREGPFADPRW